MPQKTSLFGSVFIRIYYIYSIILHYNHFSPSCILAVFIHFSGKSPWIFHVAQGDGSTTLGNASRIATCALGQQCTSVTTASTQEGWGRGWKEMLLGRLVSWDYISKNICTYTYIYTYICTLSMCIYTYRYLRLSSRDAIIKAIVRFRYETFQVSIESTNNFPKRHCLSHLGYPHGPSNAYSLVYNYINDIVW